MRLLSVNLPRLLTLALPLAFLISACSESNTGPAGGDAAQKPAIGSTFTNAFVQIDATGNPVEASRDTATATASQLLTDYEGKAEVIEFTSKTGPIYIAYEADGDVATQFLVTLQGVSENVWLTLPVATGNDVDTEVFRDTQSQGGVTSTAVARFKAENEGSKEVTINGEKLTAQHITGTITATFSFDAGGQQNEMITYYDLDIDFIPSIGMFSRYEISIRFQGAPAGGTARTNLVDFELK